MKKVSGIIWGLVLIAIGVIIAGNSLNIFNVDLFFDGWWTLFIIIPCSIGFLTDKEKTGPLIGIVVGVLLLLSCQNIIDFDVFWKLLVPIIIIIVGISILFRTIFNRSFKEDIEKLNKKIDKDGCISAVFSEQKVNLDDQDFKGVGLTAVFGGIVLDLRKAKIKEDVIINTTSIFGGVEILTSDDVNVIVKSNSVFGGVDNDRNDNKKDKKSTVYINATCIFGGLDIK